MLEEIYRIGSRNDILGFIGCSKDQYTTDELSGCSNEDEKRSRVIEQRNYLVNVLRQMFNPSICNSEVTTLNQIDDVLK
jgi:hypothetical protein